MSKTFIVHDPEVIISRLRPDHESIKWYNGGDNRSVVVVDGREAFRFPKDESGVEVGRYEFEVLKLIQGRLSVAVPQPIELAEDGSYNVLSFLQGNVLSKHEVVKLSFDKRRLSFDKRRDLGVAVAAAIDELNRTVTRQELETLPSQRSLVRNRDDYYAQIYETALHQEGGYAASFRSNYEHLQQIRPDGSANNIIVFGDFSSPNMVLSDDYQLTGLIDWTELGFGDIHNELRPIFSVIGRQAFDEMVAAIDPNLGPIDKDLVRLLAVIHELSVLVGGKQKGTLTPERTKLALVSLDQWLEEGWTSQASRQENS